MIVTHKAREALFRYPYWETFGIVVLYLLAGYMLDPNDICIIASEFSIMTIILATITLFHGISSGLLAIVLFGLAMKMGYEVFNYFYFLRELVLVLVFGEFHYYWLRTITQLKAQEKYTEKKFTEIGKAFYMLKISHDQIEKSYVTKPMSLRNSIRLIKEGHSSDNIHNSYQNFLSLIKKTLNIELAYLGKINPKGEIEIVAQSPGAASFNSRDLMVVNALGQQKPIFVSSMDSNESSDYLAVIPVISHNKNIGLFAIEKMPFLSFNKDNLIAASILVSYYFDEIYKIESLEEIGEFSQHFDGNFRFELCRLVKLKREFSLNSSLLILKSYNKLTTHLIKEQALGGLRTLDLYTINDKGAYDIIVILFPFVDQSSIKGFVRRIDEIDKNQENIQYSSFSISEISLMNAYIEGP